MHHNYNKDRNSEGRSKIFTWRDYPISKALAGTYKPINRAVKPSWFKDDGSKALAGTYKPVNRAVKPAWFRDDGSEALVKGKASDKK